MNSTQYVNTCLRSCRCRLHATRSLNASAAIAERDHDAVRHDELPERVGARKPDRLMQGKICGSGSGVYALVR